jgi:hypothetical protein
LWQDTPEVIELAKEASVPQGTASNADIIPDP